MVRAPTLTLSHAAGFALLKPASKPQLDSTRILTLSSTIALNLLVLGLLMVPMALPPPAFQEQPSHNPLARAIVKPPEPVIVEIAPITRPQPPQPVQTPAHPRSSHSPDTASTAQVLSDTGNTPVTDPVANDNAPIGDSITPAIAAPVPMQLAYRQGPPPTGTVLLQVLVGVDGRPLEVNISRSSGYRELDEAARLQVLKRWSFQPATQNGNAVQALGLVPIEFNLRG